MKTLSLLVLILAINAHAEEIENVECQDQAVTAVKEFLPMVWKFGFGHKNPELVGVETIITSIEKAPRAISHPVYTQEVITYKIHAVSAEKAESKNFLDSYFEVTSLYSVKIDGGNQSIKSCYIQSFKNLGNNE